MTFESLLENYYQSWFRYHPERAVAVGEPGYEELLTPYSDDDIGALIALNEKLLFSLEELDTQSLGPEQRLDYSILYSAASNELHELLERDWRYRNPERYLPLNAIHQLLTRPVNNLHTALKHRLQAIPAYLRGAKPVLLHQPENIPMVWLESAIQQASAGVEFIRNLSRHPVVVQKFQNPARMNEYSDTAASALQDFAHFMERELRPLAAGEFAVGQQSFERVLKEVQFLDVDADTLHRFGAELFDQTQQQINELAKELRDDGDLEAIFSDIHADSPDHKHILDQYRQSIHAAFNFVSDRDLVTIPDTQRLTVVETPRFLRHEIPFAAYDEPTRQDLEQQGHYYVTVPDDEAGFDEHNRIAIDLTSVHEAYPGHHLQFVIANLGEYSRSLVRVLNPSAVLYEGWALYCEDLMVEQGYLNKPEHRIMMLRDRLWRALRVVLDVELHCRGLTIDEAVERMCSLLGFEPQQARAELNWYTQAPTVPMSYATGWSLIRAARDGLQQNPDMSLKSFHDRLLMNGSVALPLTLQHVFGDDVWQAARDKVLKPAPQQVSS